MSTYSSHPILAFLCKGKLTACNADKHAKICKIQVLCVLCNVTGLCRQIKRHLAAAQERWHTSFVAGVAQEFSWCEKVRKKLRGVTWHKQHGIDERNCDWSGIGTSCVVGEREQERTIPRNSRVLYTHARRRTTCTCDTLAVTMLFTHHPLLKRWCTKLEKKEAPAWL